MKALLVKMSSLGDVVHALPAVSDAARVGVRFDWVVEEAFQAVPAAHPAVDRVFPIALRRWRKRPWRSRPELQSFLRDLTGARYHLAIDSQGLLKSALVMGRVRAAEKVGFSRQSAREPVATLFYRRPIDVPKHHHAIDRQRHLFSAAFGYSHPANTGIDFGLRCGAARTPSSNPQADPAANRADGPTPSPGTATESSSAPKRESPSPQRCMFLHGATWATKLWPEALWIELAELAAHSGLRPLLPWGNNEERRRAERIAQASEARVLPAMNLKELMLEIKGTRLAIGVDSGLAHLAAALDVPTLVLYGPTASSLTGCRGNNAQNLQASLPCSPCLSRTCRYRGSPAVWRGAVVAPPCYGALNPERVWAAAVETMHADRLLHI